VPARRATTFTSNRFADHARGWSGHRERILESRGTDGEQRRSTNEIDVAADSAAALDAPPEVWEHYRNLVKQAGILFGAQHYTNYHFLLTLSDHVAHFGLEHHESNDSRIDERR